MSSAEVAAARLNRFFGATAELMQVMARACGHDHLGKFNERGITTWKKTWRNFPEYLSGAFVNRFQAGKWPAV